MSVFGTIGSISELEPEQIYTLKQARKLWGLEDYTYCDCPDLC